MVSPVYPNEQAPRFAIVGYAARFPGAPDAEDGGANIIEMDFIASADASGMFGVYAAQSVYSLWTDSGMFDEDNNLVDSPMDFPFANIGTGGDAVRIGGFEVRAGEAPLIPEPHSILVWCVAGIVGFVLFPRRQKVTRE